MAWRALSIRPYQEPRRGQRLGHVHQVEAAAQVSVAQDGGTTEPRVADVLKSGGVTRKEGLSGQTLEPSLEHGLTTR